MHKGVYGSTKLWSKEYIYLSLGNFFSWLSYNMITTQFVPHVLQMGASIQFAGIAAGSFAFASTVVRPFTGLTADRINRKNLLVFTSFGMSISLLAYTLLSNPLVLLIFRSMQGVMFGFYTTVCLVCVDQFCPEHAKAKGIAYYGLFQVASMAIGPSIAIFLADEIGTIYCLILGSLFQFITVIMALLISADSIYSPMMELSVGTFTKESIIDSRIMPLSILNFTFTLFFGVTTNYIVVFALDRGIQGVNLHFLSNAIGLFLVRLLMANVLDGKNASRYLIFAFLSSIGALFLLGSSYTVLMLIIVGLLKAFSQGVSQPYLQSLSLSLVGQRRKGVASSTIYVGGDLGQALAPIFGGFMLKSLSYSIMFGYFTIPLFIGMFLFLTNTNFRGVAK